MRVWVGKPTCPCSLMYVNIGLALIAANQLPKDEKMKIIKKAETKQSDTSLHMILIFVKVNASVNLMFTQGSV